MDEQSLGYLKNENIGYAVVNSNTLNLIEKEEFYLNNKPNPNY